MTSERVLVVEDDESLGMVLVDALRDAGYRVDLERDGPKALAKATAEHYALVVLDLMLPRLDGFEILRRLRAGGDRTPVLVLTARGREEDRLKGFDLGADDYVVKPFSMKELLARVRARLRSVSEPAPDHVRVGEAAVDLGAMLVRRPGASEQPLTKTEADILRMFLRSPRQVLTRKRFFDEVWGHGAYPTTRTVDMHVARLREKLGDAGDSPRFIRTVHGVGYRYDPDGVASA